MGKKSLAESERPQTSNLIGYLPDLASNWFNRWAQVGFEQSGLPPGLIASGVHSHRLASRHSGLNGSPPALHSQ
jgi:hypothetical protein